jgi:hypothetical protein
MTILLSTAYWPNLHYYFYILHANTVCIESQDHYMKQSYRNRCEIVTANGKQALTIPVRHIAAKMKVSEVELSYATKWQANHWGAITSAYGNSPYFEYFEDEIRRFYFERTELLLDYNMSQLRCIDRILRISKEYIVTGEYMKEPAEMIDLREAIHPKKSFTEDELVRKRFSEPYYQTFSEKMPFVPNLSILDLIFNRGLDAISYLS